jgi:uncharacterized cupredoxin-like copper-binding protein
MARRDSSSVTVLPTIAGVLGVLLTMALVIILVLLARPSGGVAVPAGYQTVQVTEHEFQIQLSRSHLTPGHVLFEIHNVGTVPHEFVMWKTADAANALPLGHDGRVNEDAHELEPVIDSGSSLEPGEHRILTTDSLDAGHYVIVCNLPGHYNGGMHVDVTVA